MKVAVVVFPGSNCDHDAFHAFSTLLGVEAEFAWHKEHDLKGADLVVLPGGFSYGDYLRCGAMASRSPIMARRMVGSLSFGAFAPRPPMRWVKKRAPPISSV